jgi:hypothetical protein
MNAPPTDPRDSKAYDLSIDGKITKKQNTGFRIYLKKLELQ